MKETYPDPSNESTPLLAPSRSRHAGAVISRIRTLGLTLASCIILLKCAAWLHGWRNGTGAWVDGGRIRRKEFEWEQITPTADLNFHTCYNGFECAKLSVPLDYYNGTYPNETISIAIAKLPAKVPVNDPRYGGPILINPGGPGGPGAFFALAVGSNLQDIVDAEPYPDIKPADLKFFDILGFDPRGIGWTEPRAHCMADPAASWSWTLRENTEGILGSSDAALGRLWSMTHSWGTSCKEAMDAEDGPDIKQYMTTASVARDMLQIIEKHAEWVAAKLAALNPGMMHETDTALYKPEETKLQYWGFSYGTVLGYTFASMFPSRVGRVILDGVVSSYDYTHSLGNGSLTDNQKAMDSFYTYCLHSGPESCPLTTPNATFNSVKTRVENIIQSLYHNPLAISSPTGPEIITYSDIKSLLFSACYQPSGSFAFIAQILAAIETRTGDFLKQISAGYRYTHIYSCPVNGSTPLIDLTDAVPTYAILCSDGIDQTSVSLDEFTAYWKLLESMSPTSGAIWSMLRMRCLAWSIKPIFKFSGPFTANTSHPILFLSNTADPVTPLRSGREMHAKFPGSGLLVSDHAGHCSIAYPNPCALAHVAVYMQTGKLPQENTLCVPEQSAFSLNSTDPESRFYDPSLEGMRVEKGGVRELGVEQVKVLDAGREFARKVVEEDLFGVRRLVGGRGGDLVKSVGMWEGGV